jgi:hypothetical protein
VSEISPQDLRILVNENATLAERLEASEGDQKRLEATLEELRAELDSLRSRPVEASASSGAQPRPPVLSSAEVSGLVSRLLADLDSQLSGMSVRDGELQLKVAFEKIGEEPGFVIPSSESPPEIRENLQSISVRLIPKAG